MAEARRFAYWGQLVYFVFFFVLLIFGIIALLLGSWASGAYLLVSAGVNIIIVLLLKTTVFDTIDQGRFNEASDRLLIWGILGIIFGVLPGIFLIIAFLRIQDVFQPQYQPYPPQQYPPPQSEYQKPPQQYQQPPAPVPPQQEPARPQAQAQPQGPQPQNQQAKKPKHEMVKCKKCGVQYPAFMRTCPNCGEPR